MATPNQEETYNEFVKFYDLAESLIKITESSSKEYSQEQFDEIEKMVIDIEEMTDQLTQSYIEIVKNSKNEQKINEVRDLLGQIQLKTQKCRESLIKIYEESN